MMKIINYIALCVGIIGALNWGLIGFFNFNLVTALFGTGTLFTRIVYIIVGISGLYMLTFFPKVNDDIH